MQRIRREFTASYDLWLNFARNLNRFDLAQLCISVWFVYPRNRLVPILFDKPGVVPTVIFESCVIENTRPKVIEHNWSFFAHKVIGIKRYFFIIGYNLDCQRKHRRTIRNIIFNIPHRGLSDLKAIAEHYPYYVFADIQIFTNVITVIITDVIGV